MKNLLDWGGDIKMRSRDARLKREKQQEELEVYFSEALGVSVTAIMIFFAISLFSYNSHDYTMFYYDSDLCLVYNWGGEAGAYLSSVFFHIFGAGAYMLLGALAVLAYTLLLGYRYPRWWSGVLLLPVCVIAASVVFSLYDVDFVNGLPGGVVGYQLSSFLSKHLGFYGAAVAAWTSVWVSTIIVLRVSFVQGIIVLTRYIASSRIAFFF